MKKKTCLYRKQKGGKKANKCVTVSSKLMKILPKRLKLQICQCRVATFERKQTKLKQAFKIGFETIRTRI